MKDVKVTYKWALTEDEIFSASADDMIFGEGYTFDDYLSDRLIDFEHEGDCYYIVEYGERTGEVYQIIEIAERDSFSPIKYTDELLRRIFSADRECDQDIKNHIKHKDFFIYEDSDKNDYIQSLIDDCDETEEEALEDWESLRKVTVNGINYHIEFEC